MGRLVKYLKSTGQFENTLIIFMGDNGLLEGEHGMVDKRTAHEPSLRIPLIAKIPGVNDGRIVSKQVLTLDIAPSILDVCHVPPIEGIQGSSWKQLASTGEGPWRDSWFYEYNYEKQFPYTPNVRAIRTDAWKFIRYPHGDGSPDKHMAELYNLESDPNELRNLANNPEWKAMRSKLEKQLDVLLAAEGLTIESDKMPIDEGIKSQLPDQKIR